MIFGLPGMALAMYRCARPEKRRAAGGLLLSAALTAALTGITEPLEFTFLFVAPSMYFIHSILAGVSYMLMHLLKVGVGMTFSGGIIDFLLFGVLLGQKKTNWIMIPIVGIVYFAVYYLLFGFMIRKFNFATPGRETDGSEVKLYTRADYDDRKKRRRTSDETVPPSEPALSDADGGLESPSSLILRGLGGRENIENIDACATRLRVTVKNPGLVTDALLKKSGAAGVIRRGDGIQVVYGPQVSVIKSELEEHIDRLEAQD